MNEPISLQARIELQADVILCLESEIEQLKLELHKSKFRGLDLETLLKNEAENYRREAEDNSKLRATSDIQVAEIEQLKRGLRIAREQLEDALIELDGYRSKTTIPAPPLAPESCLPAVESRVEHGS